MPMRQKSAMSSEFVTSGSAPTISGCRAFRLGGHHPPPSSPRADEPLLEAADWAGAARGESPTVTAMQYLMLMWADADATGGDESDFQAWADFDQEVRAAGAFVFNGALQPAATQARLVQTAIAGHQLPGAVEQKPFADGERQIQAFYIMECPDLDAAVQWANRLPTYGYVEVRELLQF
jgi:hypothetical protein